MTARLERLEKGVMEQLASNLMNVSNRNPTEVNQMIQRIADIVQNATGVRLTWELPSSDKPTQQEQLDQLAALYLGA
ncbi:hypothetical protein [Larkinella humicola]|uniref:Uncharacterized protein n=1 Tax=Larkinella humicola TaxID=2607654 RepID=A0A5N1JH99_9BACT|nr:hypothetical protein [Larkinella humicola]KAA9349990.1 hypothetical protein F0P93_21385 [Larkinella humicola]